MEEEMRVLRRAHAAEIGALRHEMGLVKQRNQKLEKELIGLRGRSGVRDAERQALKAALDAREMR